MNDPQTGLPLWSSLVAAAPFVLTIRPLVDAVRDRQAQLAHWRGPGPLVEVGRGAPDARTRRGGGGAPPRSLDGEGKVEDANYPLAQALESQGRHAEAAPFLTELVAKDPDHKFGEAALALARCLDEKGDREGA